jgi:hypothetical protein
MIYLKCFLSLLLLMGVVSTSMATPVVNDDLYAYEKIDGEPFSHYANSGIFQEIFYTSPTEANIIAGILSLFPGYDLTFLGKTNYDDGTDTWDTESPGHFQADAWEDGQSGTWWTTDTPPSDVSFYTVKAGLGNSWALYWQDPAANTGSWSTYHLYIAGHSGGGLEISHLAGVKTTTYVPEPAGMLLMGAGLIAFGLIRRKRNKA